MTTVNHLERKEIYYEPGLTCQFASWRELLSVVLHSHPKGLSRAAAAADMKPSELSEAVRGINGRRIDFEALDPICEELEDWRLLDWWIEKRKEDREARRARLMDRLAMRLEDLNDLMGDPDIRDELRCRRERRGA